MHKIKVLIVYYSQSGQLEQVIKKIAAPLEENESITIDYCKIKPVKPYPFPWSMKAFFNVFPEAFREIPIDIELNNLSKNYDLVILGYQPWFLSTSLPINSFLQRQEAQELLKEAKVITVIACRNMWTQAQEKIKQRLSDIGAQLIGNIVFRDRAWNLVSLYTILRWMLYGKKGKSGISNQDLLHSTIYGKYIVDQLTTNQNIEQETLVSLGAVETYSNLIFMEKRAVIHYALFADFIMKAKDANQRQKRLLIFKIYLVTVIIIFTPLTFIITQIRALLFPGRIKEECNYFKGVKLGSTAKSAHEKNLD